MKYKNSEGQWQNIPALKGKDGATFTPHVSEDGVLSWTNDKGLENPASVNVKDKVKLDTVLEVEGRAADAKAVGDRITEIENNMPTGITVAQSEQIETNKNDIAQLKTGKADTGHTHAEISEIKEDIVNKLNVSGHGSDKYLGTDSTGNVVEKEPPTPIINNYTETVENPYALPVATETILGGIKALPKTDLETVEVKIGADGKLYVPATQGGVLDINQIASQLEIQPSVDEAGDMTFSIVAKTGGTV